jgi:hypothetical protein
MIPAHFLAFVVLSVFPGDPSKPGAAPKQEPTWIDKTESHLYCWPKPGSLVHFQVRTNMLEATIAAMEKDPEVATNPDKGKWVDALKHVSIDGTLDTETGVVTTNVDLRYEPVNPKGKAASEKLKSGVASMISNAFQGLPLHDPTLLRKGGSILGTEERGDAVFVTVTGKEKGDQNRIQLNRRSELPESIEMKDISMRVRYAEVVPGRFAPSRLDVKSNSGKESHAEYAYQKAGDIAFPSTIRVFQGPQTVTFSFVSLKVDPRPR